MGLAAILVREQLHNEAWLGAHAAGWPDFHSRLEEFPLDRVAQETGLPGQAIIDLAHRYASCRPALIKIADGINRNPNGGQIVRAICALPSLTGQYGVRGGGLAYSTSGYFPWSREAVHHWEGCPPPGRTINMNRLGAALLGEATDPLIRSLFVFGANPAASTPHTGRILDGLRRDDLFTVVHDLFLTDTADYADLVLPATSQLEHTDLHKAYGHTYLTYNRAAIEPLGECKSNWDVMGLLARALGFFEPWLHQSADEVIHEVLTATARACPAFRGITLERLKVENRAPLALDGQPPFAGGRFPTPSGKVELYSKALAAAGVDPLPGRFVPGDDGGVQPDDQAWAGSEALYLLTGASHHFVSSSLASQKGLLERAGSPFVEVHPDDASARGITDGDTVIVENGRGSSQLRAVVTDAVRPGVLVSPKGRWSKLSGGTSVNWTTSDALGDMAGQSTFHSNRVWLRRAGNL
jgi:anaerobic selenocysteine-containing dehydrogenase